MLAISVPRGFALVILEYLYFGHKLFHRIYHPDFVLDLEMGHGMTLGWRFKVSRSKLTCRFLWRQGTYS
jgi:hypothetical protein